MSPVRYVLSKFPYLRTVPLYLGRSAGPKVVYVRASGGFLCILLLSKHCPFQLYCVCCVYADNDMVLKTSACYVYVHMNVYQSISQCMYGEASIIRTPLGP